MKNLIDTFDIYHKSIKIFRPSLTNLQDVDETPELTEDSDTNPNTTPSSVAAEETLNEDGRKKRSMATQLRRSVFGKKHDILGESKARFMSSL